MNEWMKFHFVSVLSILSFFSPSPVMKFYREKRGRKKLKNKIIIITITILHEIVFVITIFIIAN